MKTRQRFDDFISHAFDHVARQRDGRVLAGHQQPVRFEQCGEIVIDDVEAELKPTDIDGIWIGALAISILCVAWAIWQSKREPTDVAE